MSKLLDFVQFNNLNTWSIHLLLENNLLFTNKYPMAYFKEFTKKGNIEKVDIKDDETYKILGVRSYGLGAYLNREVLGSTLKMKKYQKAKKDHLFWCKVDTKNGAFGIITDELEDGLGSSNMTFAELNTKKIDVNYLQLFFQSKKFNAYMDNQVVGTTNRKYIKFNDLLREIKIPLPKLDIQEQIVENYQSKIKLANQQEQNAIILEKEIEDYLYKELGLLKPIINKEKEEKLLEFLEYKDLNTWSYEQLKFNSGFKSIYNTKNFEEACILKNKSFNKKNYNDDKFNYVDIGSVDPILGILESKTISLSKAPSRATQYINTGDLIIATTRPYLKKFAIVEKKFNENVCSSGFTVIEYNPTKYNLEFIKEFLQSYYGIEQFKEKMTGGLYPAITLKELKTIKIPFPDVKIQDIIAKNINEMKNQIKLLNQQSLDNKRLALEEFEKEVFNEA